jgi:hypothetical protein
MEMVSSHIEERPRHRKYISMDYDATQKRSTVKLLADF